jgi:hypothetical protein
MERPPGEDPAELVKRNWAQAAIVDTYTDAEQNDHPIYEVMGERVVVVNGEAVLLQPNEAGGWTGGSQLGRLGDPAELRRAAQARQAQTAPAPPQARTAPQAAAPPSPTPQPTRTNNQGVQTMDKWSIPLPRRTQENNEAIRTAKAQQRATRGAARAERIKRRPVTTTLALGVLGIAIVGTASNLRENGGDKLIAEAAGGGAGDAVGGAVDVGRTGGAVIKESASSAADESGVDFQSPVDFSPDENTVNIDPANSVAPGTIVVGAPATTAAPNVAPANPEAPVVVPNATPATYEIVANDGPFNLANGCNGWAPGEALPSIKQLEFDRIVNLNPSLVDGVHLSDGVDTDGDGQGEIVCR